MRVCVSSSPACLQSHASSSQLLLEDNSVMFFSRMFSPLYIVSHVGREIGIRESTAVGELPPLSGSSRARNVGIEL